MTLAHPEAMETPKASVTSTGPRVRKLHAMIGAEIEGVDLSRPLDGSTVAFIKQAWADHIVLVFRNQNLTSDDQRNFASRFGPVAERLTPPDPAKDINAPKWKELMIISNETGPDGEALGALGQGEMWFHTDKCYVERPHRFSFLYGLVIPKQGGHTKFTSLVAAYERLSEEMKKKFDGKMVMQGHEYGAGRRINVNADLSKVHHHRQPLVVKNPWSGRNGLYVASQNTMWIEGMDSDESERTLLQLFDLCESPDLVYEHVWQVGDFVMWDNLSCLHARTDWSKDELRKLRRCTVVGDTLY